MDGWEKPKEKGKKKESTSLSHSVVFRTGHRCPFPFSSFNLHVNKKVGRGQREQMSGPGERERGRERGGKGKGTCTQRTLFVFEQGGLVWIAWMEGSFILFCAPLLKSVPLLRFSTVMPLTLLLVSSCKAVSRFLHIYTTYVVCLFVCLFVCI